MQYVDMDVEEVNLSKAKRIYLRSLSISRGDFVSTLKNAGIPKSWSNTPLLRDCYPLIFEDEVLVHGKWRIHLDKELGIVYSKSESEAI